MNPNELNSDAIDPDVENEDGAVAGTTAHDDLDADIVRFSDDAGVQAQPFEQSNIS